MSDIAKTDATAVALNAHFTTFDDESVSKYEFSLYKGRKGVKDRIGFVIPRTEMTLPVHPDGVPRPSPAWAYVHYAPNTNYFTCQSIYRRVPGTKRDVIEKPAICCERLDPAKKRFSVMVIHYSTDPGGKLVKPFGYELKIWRFGENRFLSLKDKFEEYPAGKHDLRITCEDDQYQKMEITPTKEAVWQEDWFVKEFGDAVEGWIQSMIVPQGTIPAGLLRSIAKIYTPAQLAEHMGEASPASTVDDDAPINAADLLGDDDDL